MALITEGSQRLRIEKRLLDTKPNETLCLWGWEAEVLLRWLAELEQKAKGEKKE